jgi:hypothetical protein
MNFRSGLIDERDSKAGMSAGNGRLSEKSIKDFGLDPHPAFMNGQWRNRRRHRLELS